MNRQTTMIFATLLVTVAASATFLAGVGAQTGKRVFPGVVKPIGPYSAGIGVGDTVYLAGQIGLDPASGALVSGGIEAETRQVMQNLGAVLKDANLDLTSITGTW